MAKDKDRKDEVVIIKEEDVTAENYVKERAKKLDK